MTERELVEELDRQAENDGILMARSLAEHMTREEFLEAAGRAYDLAKRQKIGRYIPAREEETNG